MRIWPGTNANCAKMWEVSQNCCKLHNTRVCTLNECSQYWSELIYNPCVLMRLLCFEKHVLLITSLFAALAISLFFCLHFRRFGFHLSLIGCKFSPFLTTAKMDVMSCSNFYLILWNLLQEYKYFGRCNWAFFEHFFSISKRFCFAFVNRYAIFGIYVIVILEYQGV